MYSPPKGRGRPLNKNRAGESYDKLLLIPSAKTLKTERILPLITCTISCQSPNSWFSSNTLPYLPCCSSTQSALSFGLYCSRAVLLAAVQMSHPLLYHTYPRQIPILRSLMFSQCWWPKKGHRTTGITVSQRECYCSDSPQLDQYSHSKKQATKDRY